MTSPLPLSGYRVADLSAGIAGGYCTKLLVDGGADVIKVEPPAGDPLRRWSASSAPILPTADGALFNYLAAGKRSIVVDPLDNGAVATLLADADAVVWSANSAVAHNPALRPDAIRREHPGLIVTAISPFGLDGPWADRAATEFTLQAWSGGIVGLARGTPERPPVYVGGQIGEWLAGVWAAIGLLASLRRAGDAGELVDVSILEAQAMGLTYYPVTFNDQLGRPMRKKRFTPTPGVAAVRDGMVGLGCGTGQQWLDFCAMVGHPEWTEDRSLFLDRTRLAPTIDGWFAEQAADDVLELAAAFRIPNAPIVNGANAATYQHFRERDTFVANVTDGATNPRPPYRLSAARLREPQPAPRLGEHGAHAEWQPRDAPHPKPRGAQPFSGLRVLDMTAYWAGPLVGHVLALLGAEVIHVESAARPDGARLVGGVPETEESFWERGPIFAALNTNKKSLTVDVSDERGATLLKRLVATCDVVVENFTPRVLDQLGLGYDQLRVSRPDLVMLRMPGFGLDGPWRDNAAFAFVIEDASGLTWLTGFPDALPVEPYCVGDPNAGLHALFGLMVALEHRDRTGEGSLVEASMVDAALNVAAEQVIEHSAYEALLSRQGNRGPCAAPQNLYRTAAVDKYDDSWVAIAVATDEQWSALQRVVDDPGWAADAALASSAGRVADQDRIDSVLGEWCRARAADEIVDLLWEAGVPVGKVMQPHHQPDLPQLSARKFFEVIDHPVAPTSRYCTLPMRFSDGPGELHVRHAPLLGEHNAELLAELGVSGSDLAGLEADGIIGRSVTMATGAK